MTEALKHKAPLFALCAWCVFLLAARALYSGHLLFEFLVWNLFLAGVPVGAALVLRALSARGVRTLPAQSLVFALWLLFLPNAPYLLTDLVHLEYRPPVPLWFDVAMLTSFAATGLLLAYASVADVEAVVARRFGRWAGSGVALLSLALSGIGIYLGRFWRWNSWDLLTSPTSVARDALDFFGDPLADPRAWAVPVIYGIALVLGYLAVRGISRTFPSDDDGGQR